MTKDKIPYLIILVLIVVSTLLYFRGNKKTDVSSYKNQITLLQSKKDSLNSENILLKDTIKILYSEKNNYIKQVIDLNNKLKYEKKKTQSMVDAVDAWSDNDIQWFFANRYKGFYPDSITSPSSKISR